MLTKDSWTYISGSMRGIPDYNGPAFNEAERRLRAAGVKHIFNPYADDVLRYGQAAMISDKGDTPGNFDLRSVIKRDLNWICDHATHMYMLPGWTLSKGATLEHQLAVYLGLEIIESSPRENAMLKFLAYDA